MTDLEITEACARAMGLVPTYNKRLPFIVNNGWEEYHPLADDAQAMALIKKFNIELFFVPNNLTWWATSRVTENNHSNALDLNRAIYECVARIARNLQEVPCDQPHP